MCQQTVYRAEFSLFTTGVTGTELRLSGLATSAFYQPSHLITHHHRGAFTVQLWMAWNSLCRKSSPRIHLPLRPFCWGHGRALTASPARLHFRTGKKKICKVTWQKSVNMGMAKTCFSSSSFIHPGRQGDSHHSCLWQKK